MIAVLQRVKKASVSIDGKTVGECAKGLMILLGVADGDEKIDAEFNGGFNVYFRTDNMYMFTIFNIIANPFNKFNW